MRQNRFLPVRLTDTPSFDGATGTNITQSGPFRRISSDKKPGLFLFSKKSRPFSSPGVNFLIILAFK
ncbi:MAG: hypothetical protein DSY58_02430 [Desulfobulbus sp.]|nr:MAG: hypothetical protein DSY58_02430 [Desulfobulbus sp.]RUM42041.1 MAG: hypothetical protein DSY70_00120 [Desulfobulbus sp.]